MFNVISLLFQKPHSVIPKTTNFKCSKSSTLNERRRKARYDAILTLFTFESLTQFEKKLRNHK